MFLPGLIFVCMIFNGFFAIILLLIMPKMMSDQNTLMTTNIRTALIFILIVYALTALTLGLCQAQIV